MSFTRFALRKHHQSFAAANQSAVIVSKGECSHWSTIAGDSAALFGDFGQGSQIDTELSDRGGRSFVAQEFACQFSMVCRSPNHWMKPKDRRANALQEMLHRVLSTEVFEFVKQNVAKGCVSRLMFADHERWQHNDGAVQLPAEWSLDLVRDKNGQFAILV